jgi:hypothetical protein
MDAALEHFPSKAIFGLLIVEGDGGAGAVSPSQHWSDECTAQYHPLMLADSLPHRTAIDRQLLAAGVLGVTTWQAVCAATNVPWSSLPDAI